MCTTAHERVDVVAFRKDYVSHWGTIKHRVVRGSGPEVEALLGKPYEYRFSPEEQAVLKVTLHDKPDGTQERPLLVRWQAASHQGPSPITFQIVEVFPLNATSQCDFYVFPGHLPRRGHSALKRLLHETEMGEAWRASDKQ